MVPRLLDCLTESILSLCPSVVTRPVILLYLTWVLQRKSSAAAEQHLQMALCLESGVSPPLSI